MKNVNIKETVDAIKSRSTLYFSNHTIKCISSKYNLDENIVKNIFEKRLMRHNSKVLTNDVSKCHIAVNHNSAYDEITRIF